LPGSRALLRRCLLRRRRFLGRRLLFRRRFPLRARRRLRRRERGNGARDGGTVRIQTSVILGRPEDALAVLLCFREWNVVDELVLVETGALRLPPGYAAVSGVVAGQRVLSPAE